MSFQSKPSLSRRRLISAGSPESRWRSSSPRGLRPRPAKAGLLTCVAPVVIAAPGATGSFDVLLVNNDSMSYNVAGDAFMLSLSPSTGVTFTDATTMTVTPYIYQASSDVVTWAFRFTTRSPALRSPPPPTPSTCPTFIEKSIPGERSAIPSPWASLSPSTKPT